MLLKSHTAEVSSATPLVATIQKHSRWGRRNRLYVSRMPHAVKNRNPARAAGVTGSPALAHPRPIMIAPATKSGSSSATSSLRMVTRNCRDTGFTRYRSSSPSLTIRLMEVKFP